MFKCDQNKAETKKWIWTFGGWQNLWLFLSFTCCASNCAKADYYQKQDTCNNNNVEVTLETARAAGNDVIIPPVFEQTDKQGYTYRERENYANIKIDRVKTFF